MLCTQFSLILVSFFCFIPLGIPSSLYLLLACLPGQIFETQRDQMEKVVVNVEVYNTKDKQKAMKAVSSISGIDSIAMDMTEKKMTVIGEVDPVDIVGKLRKFWRIEIDFVGPPDDPNALALDAQAGEATDPIIDLVDTINNGAYNYNYPYRTRHYYLDTIAEENPNASCVIT